MNNTKWLTRRGLGRLFYPALQEPWWGEPCSVEESLWIFVPTVEFIEDHWDKRWRGFLDLGARNVFTAYLEKQLEIHILSTIGDLDRNAQYPDGIFDCAFCFQVLEHLTNPLHTLDKVHQRLSIEGVLFLSVPIRFQSNWGAHHYCEPSPDRLKYLFEKAGFEVAEVQRMNLPDMFGFGIRPMVRKLASLFFWGYREGMFVFLLRKRAKIWE